MNRTHTLLLIVITVTLTQSAFAENVDLSTIPGRETVQLTVYNSEDLTLVRETRHITFSKGVNPLQFSWANTLIDPSSVDLRFKSHGNQLDVLDTTYPHDKPQMLYWNVVSEMDGEARVEITYFTSGITWEADYVCISDPAETQMSFDGHVAITNNSGEDYENARIRLVVGEINLVEKVAELAQLGLVPAMEAERFMKRKNFAKMEAGSRARVLDAVSADFARAEKRPKEIIKQGLSEYFIYTIAGTETIRNTWSRRLRLFEGQRVPFGIQYRFRPAEYGEQMVRLYILRNDEASELGTTPLPDGLVRVFRDNGRDGLSFLAAHPSKYVPIGQEIELNLGVDPHVVHERVRVRSWRENIWFQDRPGRKFFSLDDKRQVRHDYAVAGWDEHARWIERIRNYRDKPIDVEIRRTFDGHVIFTSTLDPTLFDYRTPRLVTRVDAGQRRDLGYEVTVRQGINSKQSNVTLATRSR